MVGFVFSKIKNLILFIITIIKKSLCCFRRRRKSDADVVPLTAVGVVPNFSSSKDESVVRWNEWGTAMGVTVQDRIAEYRQQQVKPEPVEEIPDPDYFQDMVPEIKRPPKVFFRPKDQPHSSVDRLSFVQDNVIPTDGGELSTWEERSEESSAWAEAGGWDDLLREKRRNERHARRTAPAAS